MTRNAKIQTENTKKLGGQGRGRDENILFKRTLLRSRI